MSNVPHITITIPDQVAAAALNALASTLPINQTPVYQEFFNAVRRAEDARNEAALNLAIAQRDAASKAKE